MGSPASQVLGTQRGDEEGDGGPAEELAEERFSWLRAAGWWQQGRRL